MEGLFSEEDIQRIFAENDPIQGLSKSELEMLRDIIIKKRAKLNTMIGSTDAEKANIAAEFVNAGAQLRIVELRLGIVNK